MTTTRTINKKRGINSHRGVSTTRMPKKKPIAYKDALDSIAESKIVPINFHIDAEATAVAITGPNTGGQTASLKTLGILVLMARAGMYLPCGGESSEHEQQILPFVRTVACDLGCAKLCNLAMVDYPRLGRTFDD